jgi:hypothetical protein
VENEKSFLQRLYEALEAEDLDPKNNPGPTRTPLEGLKASSWPPPTPLGMEVAKIASRRALHT